MIYINYLTPARGARPCASRHRGRSTMPAASACCRAPSRQGQAAFGGGSAILDNTSARQRGLCERPGRRNDPGRTKEWLRAIQNASWAALDIGRRIEWQRKRPRKLAGLASTFCEDDAPDLRMRWQPIVPRSRATSSLILLPPRSPQRARTPASRPRPSAANHFTVLTSCLLF